MCINSLLLLPLLFVFVFDTFMLIDWGDNTQCMPNCVAIEMEIFNLKSTQVVEGDDRDLS